MFKYVSLRYYHLFMYYFSQQIACIALNRINAVTTFDMRQLVIYHQAKGKSC